MTTAVLLGQQEAFVSVELSLVFTLAEGSVKTAAQEITAARRTRV